jgi:glycosyltransferase involved in cell wall biosynthesis
LAGSQRSLLAAVVAGRAIGLEPSMVFPADGAMVDACRAQGLPVRIEEGTPAFHTFGKALLHLGPTAGARVVMTELLPYARRLARVVETERAQVVHFNTARGALMAGLGAHLAGVDVVLHVRGVPAISSPMWAMAQALSGRLILVARALERYVAPSVLSRTRVVYNGVVPPLQRTRDDARAAAERLGVPAGWMSGDVPVLVALSSLVPFKGVHHLVRAVRSLRDKGVEARVVVAGSGLDDAYEAWVRHLPSALGVAESFAFVGFVSDVAPLLLVSDALVLPSVEREHLEVQGRHVDVRGNEGLPRSVLEAMAAGRAVVASNIAGVREQIEHGKTGLLVPPGDVEALATALGAVVIDAEFRRTAGAAAAQVARERFGVAAAGQGLVDVLREAAVRRALAARVLDGLQAFAGALALEPTPA